MNGLAIRNSAPAADAVERMSSEPSEVTNPKGTAEPEARSARRHSMPVISGMFQSEMTGIECLQALRAQGSQVPFGFVTSEGSPEMREKAANAGALFLIAKPLNEETFADALTGVIK